MSSSTYSALEKLDASRLPFAELEKYVYALDRRKLLDPLSHTDEKKETDDDGGDSNRMKQKQSTFIVDSEEYIYYKMLQIDNEIESEQIKLKNSTNLETNIQKIQKLQHEFEEYVAKKDKRSTSQKRTKLIIRNRMRNIMNVDNKPLILDSIQRIDNVLINKYDHQKDGSAFPMPGSSTTKDDIKQTPQTIHANTSVISQSELANHITTQMEQWLRATKDEEKSHPSGVKLATYFKPSAFQWLSSKLSSMNAKQKQELIRISDFDAMFDQDETMQLILNHAKQILDAAETRESKSLKNTLNSKCDRLTLDQLNTLSTEAPALLDQPPFIDLYLKKLMPVELQIYKNKDWEDEVPMDLKWKYISGLYGFTQKQISSSQLIGIKTYIHFQYLLMYKQVHDRYDMECVIAFLAIPKRSAFNNELRQDNDEYSRKAARFHRGSSSFLSALFRNVPEYDYFYYDTERVFFNSFFEHFFTHNANIKQEAETLVRLTEFVDDEYVKKAKYKAFIENAIHMGEQNEYMKYLGYGDTHKNRVCIEFDQDRNRRKPYKPGEEIKQQHIDYGMNLDGLSASYEWIVTESELGLKTACHRKQIALDIPKEIRNKRGIYFVDLLSNGVHARSVLRIGHIDFVERISEAGHVFTLFDENNQVIRNASIYMSGHLYKTKPDKSEIFIPFTRHSGTKQIILQRDDDKQFNVLSTFNQQYESYELECGIYLDREQLLEKKQASIMVRSALRLTTYESSTQITLKLLKNIQLSITFHTADGVDVHKTFNDFELFDDKESVVSIMVPNETFNVTATLTCHVTNITNNRLDKLKHTQSFEINQIDKTKAIEQLFLIPTVRNGYTIALYGKNGEGIQDEAIGIKLYHKALKQYIKLETLKTDKVGRVYLQSLPQDIYKIYASARNTVSKEWDLHNNGVMFCHAPKEVQMSETQTVCIPYNGTIDGCTLTDTFRSVAFNDEEHVRIDAQNGCIYVSNLRCGSYQLRIRSQSDDMVDIYVSKQGTRIDDRYNLNGYELIEVSDFRRLQIVDIKQNKNEIEIRLNGHNDHTRVHVFASHFFPSFSVHRYLYNKPDDITPYSIPNGKKTLQWTNNEYLKQRNIGDEYRYCIERAKSAKYIGNSLVKPTLLTKPLAHKDRTRIAKEKLKKGGSLHYERDRTKYKKCKKKKCKKRKGGGGYSSDESEDDYYRYRNANKDRSNMEFVGVQSVCLTNLKPDDHGTVRIDATDIRKHNKHFIRVVAMDDQQCVVQSQCLDDGTSDVSYYDVSLKPGLDPKYQYKDSRNIELLCDKGQSITIHDLNTSQIESYQTLRDIYQILLTVSNNTQLESKWSFLPRWNKLSFDEKMKKYNEEFVFCHEFNLFLFKKDAVFFEKVARPLIASRLHKDCVDHYLLKNMDVLCNHYCKMENFSRLNPLEKILLISAMEDDKEPLHKDGLLKHFKDKQNAIVINPNNFDKLFRTALASKAVQAKYKSTPAPEPYYGVPAPMPGAAPLPGGVPIPCGAPIPGGAPMAAPLPGGAAPLPGGAPIPMGAPSPHGMMGMPIPMGAPLPGGAPPPMGRPPMMGGRPRPRKRYEEERKDMESLQLFKQLDKTKEYQDTYYFKMKYEHDTNDVVRLNKFWCSYAIHQLIKKKDTPFLSQYFLFATESIHELLLVLTVLDVPFDAEPPIFKYDEQNPNTVSVIANGPTVVFAKELHKHLLHNMDQTESKHEDEQYQYEGQSNESISIHIHYFDPSDMYKYDTNGNRMDKNVNRFDFRPSKVYGCSVILTNVSSNNQQMALLMQIPTGSIPVHNGFRTRTEFISVSAYSVFKKEFYFYWPSIGRFRHYPITVTKDEQIIGSSKKSVSDKCEVVVKYKDKHHKIDVESWKDVALNGTNDEVLQYITTHNVNTLDLSLIYYRFKDKPFFDQIFAFFKTRHDLQRVVWSYQWYHFTQLISNAWKDNKQDQLDDAIKMELQQRLNDGVREYLLREHSVLQYLTPSFESEHMAYDDITHHKYSHLEYYPLVNNRAHLIGAKRQIFAKEFREQYSRFLKRCSFRSTSVLDLKYDDLICGVYYLLLQDRIEDALDVFNIIENNPKMQQIMQKEIAILYDYLKAYMSLFNSTNEDISETTRIASDIVAKYRKVELLSWKRKLFEDIEVLLSDLVYKREDEDDQDYIVNDPSSGDRNRKLEKLSSKQASIQMVINADERKLVLSYTNVTQCVIHFYKINTEIVFSQNPFSMNNMNEDNPFSYIAANTSLDIELPQPKHDGFTLEYVVKIPDELRNCDTIVECVSDTITICKAFYDHSLVTQIKENYGQIKVFKKTDKNKIIPAMKAYVKVYSQAKGCNDHTFYKDGYCDIRGKFDFVSISTDQLEKVNKFSIFVQSDGSGCLVQQCNPPKR
eukprot:1066243_1